MFCIAHFEFESLFAVQMEKKDKQQSYTNIKIGGNPVVELKQSKVHGKGIFALVNVPAFMHMCNYNGIDYNSREYKGDHSFALSFDRGTKLRIGFNPPRTVWGIGQYINDGYKPNFKIVRDLPEKYHTLENIQKILIDYHKKSKSLMNCTWGLNPSNYFEIYTIQSLSTGNELFVSYGPKYWLASEQSQSIGSDSWKLQISKISKNQSLLEQIEHMDSNEDLEKFAKQQENMRVLVERGLIDPKMIISC